MSLLSPAEILIDGYEDDDGRGDQRKEYVEGEWLAGGQQHETECAPQERDADSLTVGYFSTCHAYLLLLEVKGGGSAWTRSTSGISSREGKPKKAYLKTLH